MRAIFVVLAIAALALAVVWHRRAHAHAHVGFLSIDTLAYQSGLARWNPAFKVVLCVGVLVLCIGGNRPALSLFVLLTMSALTVFGGGVCVGVYASLLKLPLVFLLMSSVAIAVNVTHAPFGDAWIRVLGLYACVTKAGLLRAGALMLKALASVSTLYFLSLSTPSGEIISVLQRVHVPQVLVDLMNLIYRCIFILMEVQCRLRSAAQSRLGFVDFRASVHSFGLIARSLLILSLRKANAYYDAMRARCYQGQLLFLEEEKPLDARLVVGAVGYAALCAALAFLPY